MADDTQTPDEPTTLCQWCGYWPATTIDGLICDSCAKLREQEALDQVYESQAAEADA